MYKQAKDNDIIVILGDLAKQYHTVPLSLVNKRLHEFGFYSVSLNDLNKVKESISSKSDKSIFYQQVKSNSIRLEDYFNKDKDALPQNLTYTDDAGLEAEITLQDLDRFLNIKEEYQKGYTGNVAWVKIKKRCAELGFSISNSPSFLKLVKWREAELAKTPSLISHSDVYAKDVSRVFEKELGDLNLKKRDAQTHSNAFNKLKRELTDQYLFRQQLLEAIPDIVNIGSLPKVKKTKGGETLIVSVSDIHVGLKTKNYDYEVLKQRMGYYVAQVKDYISTHNVSHVIIVGLGDLIEGAYMHTTQLYELEFEMGEQVSKALNLLLNFSVGIRKLGVKTSYVAISGNHDRLNGLSKKDNLLGDSIVDIINAIVEEKSKDLGIDYIVPDTKVRHLLSINGTNIALVHGDIDKLQDKAVISKLSSFFNKKVDTVLAGHLHSFWLITLGYNQYLIQTSSAFDGNSYSDKLGVKNTPGQMMLSINKKGVITPHLVIFEK